MKWIAYYQKALLSNQGVQAGDSLCGYPRPQNLRVLHMYNHGVIHAAKSMIAAGMAVAATMALNRPAVSDVATAL